MRRKQRGGNLETDNGRLNSRKRERRLRERGACTRRFSFRDSAFLGRPGVWFRWKPDVEISFPIFSFIVICCVAFNSLKIFYHKKYVPDNILNRKTFKNKVNRNKLFIQLILFSVYDN